MTDPARDFLEAGADLIPHKPEAATMRELEDLFLIVDAAREKFGEAIKATAEKTGYSSSAIRKAVRATVKDKIGEAARGARSGRTAESGAWRRAREKVA